MKSERLKRYKDGLWAETVASCYLTLKGYRVCARRFKTPVGDIEIIARKKDVLAFIEVKRRPSHDEGARSVTPQMQGRIVRAAGAYLSRNPGLAGHAMRFDVITVAPFLRVRHLDNAWRPRA
jgi:putative endonuclease